MLQVLSITFYFHYNIWGCMCSTGPFQYRFLKGYIYSSCYYHHQIGSVHLSYCYHVFRGCVLEMFVTSYSVTYCIYVPGKPGIYFVECVNNIKHILSVVHYTICGAVCFQFTHSLCDD